MRSLAARIVALVAVVALASALLTAAVLVRSLGAANREAAAAALVAEAENLADRLSGRRPVGQVVAVRRLARLGVRVALADVGGRPPPTPFTPEDVVAGAASAPPAERAPSAAPPERASPPPPAEQAAPAPGDGPWLVVGRPTDDGRVVLLARPLASAVSLSVEQRQRVAFGALAVLAVGALGGVVLARGVARPLSRLAAAARRLSAGDRDVRVARQGPPEVADVAAALGGLADQLAASEDRQRRFLLAVSHELRTPLTAVTGYAEALSDGVLPADEVPRAAAVIRAEAGRLQRRVEDLLALARLEADDFRLQPASTDLAELVRSAADAWRARAEAAGVLLHREEPGAPVYAWVDGERVRQAVDALVDNALRVLPAGVPLVLACMPAGPDRAQVQVRDGGPGIDPEELAAAFERGRLTERYRGERPVGSGLGLALVAALAKRMGGRAVAGVAPEGGAAFTLLLPARPPSGRPGGGGDRTRTLLEHVPDTPAT